MSEIEENKVVDNQKLLKSLQHDIEYTTENYANIYNRLKDSDFVFKVFLIEYSICAIINALIPKFFSLNDNLKNILDFTSVVISIILLVASLSISLANYSDRIQKSMNAVNKLKRMKKALSSFDEKDFNKLKYEEYTKKYHEIVDNMEFRNNIDFFKTCKRFNVINERFNWIKRFKYNLYIILLDVFYYFILLLPIVAYIYALIVNLWF